MLFSVACGGQSSTVTRGTDGGVGGAASSGQPRGGADGGLAGSAGASAGRTAGDSARGASNGCPADPPIYEYRCSDLLRGATCSYPIACQTGAMTVTFVCDGGWNLVES